MKNKNIDIVTQYLSMCEKGDFEGLLNLFDPWMTLSDWNNKLIDTGQVAQVIYRERLRGDPFTIKVTNRYKQQIEEETVHFVDYQVLFENAKDVSSRIMEIIKVNSEGYISSISSFAGYVGTEEES